MLGGSVAGVQVSEKTALEVTAVYGSVSVLADAVSTLPIRQYRKNLNGPDIEVEPSPVVATPFVEITQQDWFVQGMVSLTLRGNSYALITQRDPATLLPSQLKPIHPDHVRVRRLSDGTIEYRVGGVVVPIDNIKHVRNLQVPGSAVGLNPVEMLRNTLGIARAEELYGAAFFANSTNPSGVIYAEGDMTEEETLDLARSWTQAHQGIGHAQLPAVLTGGLKWEQISVNPEDAQFLESRQLSQSLISGTIFRVPPHMIGIVDRSTSWGTGIEQQELGFTRNTVGGYLGKWEAMYSTCVPPREYVKFDLSARLAGDTPTRYAAYSSARTAGWLLSDEIREKEKMAPLPDGIGKNPMQPLNSAAPAPDTPPTSGPEKSPSGF
jgi:HK97 family phage portal protein